MKRLIPFILISIILVSCKTDTKTPDMESEDALPGKAVTAVCIHNGLPIREEPRKDSKWISSMSLGETAIYKGELVIDSADKVREYCNLELSDGASYWVQSYGILLEAKPAAVVKETPLYKRPELVTKTNKSFSPSEFLAIINEKDEWVEVIGAEKRKNGWINKEVLSTQAEDIAIATLAQRELLNKDGSIQFEKLSDFMEDIPYREASLAIYLNQQMEEYVSSAIEESIRKYEND